MSTGETQALTTDKLGVFSVVDPLVASYRFSSALPGSECTDAIIKAVVRFPMALYLPTANSTVINSIALLTVPAADDATVAKRYTAVSAQGRAQAYLWKFVYGMFGYDADALGVSKLTAASTALLKHTQHGRLGCEPLPSGCCAQGTGTVTTVSSPTLLLPSFLPFRWISLPMWAMPSPSARPLVPLCQALPAS